MEMKPVTGSVTRVRVFLEFVWRLWTLNQEDRRLFDQPGNCTGHQTIFILLSCRFSSDALLDGRRTRVTSGNRWHVATSRIRRGHRRSAHLSLATFNKKCPYIIRVIVTLHCTCPRQSPACPINLRKFFRRLSATAAALFEFRVEQWHSVRSNA